MGKFRKFVSKCGCKCKISEGECKYSVEFFGGFVGFLGKCAVSGVDFSLRLRLATRWVAMLGMTRQIKMTNSLSYWALAKYP